MTRMRRLGMFVGVALVTVTVACGKKPPTVERPMPPPADTTGTAMGNTPAPPAPEPPLPEPRGRDADGVAGRRDRQQEPRRSES